MLTKQQKKFVREYLKSLSATDAAIKAGYKGTSAAAIAATLLESDAITDSFEGEIGKMLTALEIPIGYVVKRLVRIAEFAAYEEDGTPRDANLVLKALEALTKRIPGAQSSQNSVKVDGIDINKL